MINVFRNLSRKKLTEDSFSIRSTKRLNSKIANSALNRAVLNPQSRLIRRLTLTKPQNHLINQALP